ncbi:transcription initiation factor IIE beta subunit (TFIIE-BETA) like protein [Zymoseptoria brevis]|uniref:Transcription initiation factor IIE subunit beta n=1 Tax=Zymoseptoria brevis TaxID=1047168 RepID=A0A0F4GBC6_9PEZI|nr:transcription initiation factor IIE beta subunit (TFIIE-BETA) like protein [Zymoseptoria brevis]
MALQGSLAKFKSEYADATSRNVSQSRPSSTAPARITTPKSSTPTPATVDLTKRSHETAFAAPSGGSGNELLTQVNFAVGYLKSKNPQALPFDELIRHLSLPLDAQKNIPFIRTALAGNERVQFVSKSESGNGHDSFRYRPQHPVTNAEELKNYLARQITARGIPVKELKDGWPGCIPAIDALEKEGAILVTRLTKDNTPKMVWPDSPSYHVHIDDDFREFWNKTKLPPTETEIRTELEKAGLTPTSQVKETKKTDNKKKDRKRPNRRGGMKTTNSHMTGILKDYNKR